MQIEALSAFFAAISLTTLQYPQLIFANEPSPSDTPDHSTDHPIRGDSAARKVPLDDTSSKRMTYREMQNVIRKESGNENNPVDCCPTIDEMVEPTGGRNREDMYVELYRDGQNIQRFFEYSCKPEVLNKPCRFVDWKLSNQSRCVQKFSYTYAIVKTPGAGVGSDNHKEHVIEGINMSNSTWSLDYIQVRSGCSCEILPKMRKGKKQGVTAEEQRVGI